MQLVVNDSDLSLELGEWPLKWSIDRLHPEACRSLPSLVEAMTGAVCGRLCCNPATGMAARFDCCVFANG
jgi:hypothetical protein